MLDIRNLSLIDAAARIGVAPHTLRRWAVYQGRLPYLKLGRRLLFRPSDLEAFERASLVVPPSARGGTRARGEKR